MAFVNWLRRLWLGGKKAEADRWLVDRDGRVYLPTRPVEIQARNR